MSDDQAFRVLETAFAGTSGPVYLRIADAIGAAVGTGALRPGDRLPPQRGLGQRLGVDFTTVTRAYAEARRRGLLDGEVGRGTFVRLTAPEPEPALIDLGMNLPPPPDEPRLEEALSRGIAEALGRADAHALMSYQTGAGGPADRALAAAWLVPRLGEVSPDRVFLCAGAQAGLAAVLPLVAPAGATVLCEALTYPGLRSAAAHLGVRLVGVATDSEGLIPEALEEACRTEAARALYCIPTNQNPTTATLSEQRRKAVAAIARRHDLALIEDDAYGALAADPFPALARFAPERTFHLATLSKCLTPGLRVAFLVAPDGWDGQRLLTALRAVSLMPPPLMVNLVGRWLRDGTAQALVAGVRREAAARQRLLRERLPQASLAASSDGFHAWLSLPAGRNRLEFVESARRQALAVVPSDAFQVAGQPADAVRISLGAARSRERLDRGLRALADLWGGPPAASLLHTV